MGYVGVAHDVGLPGRELLFSHVRLHGGPAPVRRFLPELIDLIWNRQIDPGQVFDLTLPLAQVPRPPGDQPGPDGQCRQSHPGAARVAQPMRAMAR